MATTYPLRDLTALIKAKGPKRRVAFVTGAGASYPYPTAVEVKTGVVRALLDAAASGPLGQLITNDIRAQLLEARRSDLDNPYLTLENVFLLCEQGLDEFGTTSYFDTNTVIRTFLSGLRSSAGSLALAHLRRLGYAGPIVTANFDTLLVDTLDRLAVRYTLKTERQFEASGVGASVQDDDLVAFHGTLVEGDYTSPTSLVARGLIHPFGPGAARWFIELLGKTTDQQHPDGPLEVVIYGYSGCDYFDFNVVIQQALRTNPRGVDLDRLHWISFQGDQSDLSPFVRELDCRYYGGMSPGARADFPAAVLLDSEFQFDVSTLSQHGLFTDGLTVWAEKPAVPQYSLSNVAASEQPILASRAQAVLAHLANGFVSAWAVTEHYALESYGFDQDVIKSFSRPKRMSDGKLQSAEYFGVDMARFIEAQEAYFAVRFDVLAKADPSHLAAVGNASPDQAMRLLFNNPAVLNGRSGVAATFDELERDVASALSKEAGVDPENPFFHQSRVDGTDTAMLFVFLSMANDYLGLMAMRVMDAIDRAPTIAASGARMWAASRYAMALFSRAERMADLARTFAGRSQTPPEQAIRDLVPYLIWSLIARENHARSMLDEVDSEAKLQALERCVADRAHLIDVSLQQTAVGKRGLEQVATYFLPQATLRATEGIKSFFRWSDPGKPMPPFNTLNPNSRDEVDRLLVQARSLREKHARRSNLPNYRFITVYDCEIIDGLARNDLPSVRDAADRLAKDYLATGAAADPRVKLFVRNVHLRIDQAIRALGDHPDLKAALVALELANSP